MLRAGLLNNIISPNNGGTILINHFSITTTSSELNLSFIYITNIYIIAAYIKAKYLIPYKTYLCGS